MQALLCCGEAIVQRGRPNFVWQFPEINRVDACQCLPALVGKVGASCFKGVIREPSLRDTLTGYKPHQKGFANGVICVKHCVNGWDGDFGCRCQANDLRLVNQRQSENIAF